MSYILIEILHPKLSIRDIASEYCIRNIFPRALPWAEVSCPCRAIWKAVNIMICDLRLAIADFRLGFYIDGSKGKIPLIEIHRI